MLTHPTHDRLLALGLTGIAKALEEQRRSTAFDDLTFEERLGILVDREAAERDGKKLASRLKFAALRQDASVEDLDLRTPRGLDRSMMAHLADGGWIARHENLLITGPTGLGKSWIACALGHKACRDGRPVLYQRAPRMFEALALARGDGRHERILKTIARMDVLIIDDGGWPSSPPRSAAAFWKSSKTATAALPPSPPANCPSNTGTRPSATPLWPTPMELVLQEIARRFGAAARFDAASMFLNAPRRAGEPDGAFGGLPSHPDPRVRKALDLMAVSIESPRSLPEIAAAAGLTLRTMARIFETELGLSPGKCYQHLRLARARELMFLQGMSAADTAPLCGFSSAASLKRALSRSNNDYSNFVGPIRP